MITPLRDIVAEILFKRKRNREFEVIGTEGTQAVMAYAILTLINLKDEVIITDPGYFFFDPPIVIAGGRTKRIILQLSDALNSLVKVRLGFAIGSFLPFRALDPINYSNTKLQF